MLLEPKRGESSCRSIISGYVCARLFLCSKPVGAASGDMVCCFPARVWEFSSDSANRASTAKKKSDFLDFSCNKADFDASIV